jgi:hypothetical protein
MATHMFQDRVRCSVWWLTQVAVRTQDTTTPSWFPGADGGSAISIVYTWTSRTCVNMITIVAVLENPQYIHHVTGFPMSLVHKPWPMRCPSLYVYPKIGYHKRAWWNRYDQMRWRMNEWGGVHSECMTTLAFEIQGGMDGVCRNWWVSPCMAGVLVLVIPLWFSRWGCEQMVMCVFSFRGFG